MDGSKSFHDSQLNYLEMHGAGKIDWRTARGSRYRDYRRLWDQAARERLELEFPLHVDIETTNNCNLACPMCPRTQLVQSGDTDWSPQGKIGNMDLDFYRSIVDQAAASGAYSVKLNFLGEPLVHPDVIEQVAYARQRGLWVMMNTNAVRLTEKMSRELLEAGVSDVFLSFDSPDPASYERIRVGASYERVVENIARFVELKYELKKYDVQIRASMVTAWGDKIAVADEEARYVELFRRLGVDEIGFGVYSDPFLDYSTLVPGPVEGFGCDDVFRRLFILWDGAAQICCGEWRRQLIIGHARSASLREIWRGPGARAMRAAQREGRYHLNPHCARCSLPYFFHQERVKPRSSALPGPTG